MFLSCDCGGSTLDLVKWRGGRAVDFQSFELRGLDFQGFEAFLRSLDCFDEVERICVTGGKSRSFNNKVGSVELQRIDEISAIGFGGAYLVDEVFLTGKSCLVVSMGTGTCMVKVGREGEKFVAGHVGGTGVGGGTFWGLSKELLGESGIAELVEMFKRGDSSKVDLSVGDIVGGDIGIVKADATASNFGRLIDEVVFEKSDLALGIVNLIGQTIAITSVFAAKASGCETVVLGGKLVRIQRILDVILKIVEDYGLKVVVPENAEFIAAVGAGAFLFGEDV